MASLQSSCTLLSNPNPRNNISQIRKPSTLLTSPSRSHRFQVSCSSGSDNGGGSIDRRNMLLGLGGLYGASNLISDPKARADPLEAPDLETCDTKGATTKGDALDLSKGVEAADKVLPITLKDTVRVLVKKTKTGKADETLVLEKIVTDNEKLIKFDVFVNDEDDKPDELDRAEYAGQFTQLPHRVKAKNSVSNLRLNLKELYENINIADDDTIVVTIVPHINGDAVTIGGIKIIPRT